MARFQVKYRMSGRAEKVFRERQEVRRPRTNGHDHNIGCNRSPVMQHNASHSAVVFDERRKSAAFAQPDAERFGMFDELCHHPSAFCVTSFEVEEAVGIPFCIPRRKALVQHSRIDALNLVTPFLEQLKTFVLEVARLHRPLAQV